jgi:hypothetical protein
VNLVSTSLQLANIVLQCVLVVLLLRNFARRYSILLVYSVAHLFATLMGEFILRRQGWQSAAYRTLYWRGEVGLDLLLFLTVLVLIQQALEDSPARKSVGPTLGLVVVLALILPFVLLKSHFSTRWFDGAGQMLNFGAVLLNLGLWSVLPLRKKSDPRLLGVSLGVGVTVTGAAIGYGLLQRLSSGREFINLFAAAAHTTGVALWCRAFIRPLKISTE